VRDDIAGRANQGIARTKLGSSELQSEEAALLTTTPKNRTVTNFSGAVLEYLVQQYTNAS
jgi:hypothetical protein